MFLSVIAFVISALPFACQFINKIVSRFNITPTPWWLARMAGGLAASLRYLNGLAVGETAAILSEATVACKRGN